MIKLAKIEEPQVLRENSGQWLQIIRDKVDAGLEPTKTEESRYRHPDIKSALIEETGGKCAYCESYLRHIAYGDVEHIFPKNLDIDLSFVWSNLTLACDVCNTGKAKHLNIVDPYVDEPSSHFKFKGPMIVPSLHSDRATTTKIRLKLNRTELLERRTERLAIIADRLLMIYQARDVDLKSALFDDLVDNELSDRSEYCAFARSFISDMGIDLSEGSDQFLS